LVLGWDAASSKPNYPLATSIPTPTDKTGLNFNRLVNVGLSSQHFGTVTLDNEAKLLDQCAEVDPADHSGELNGARRAPPGDLADHANQRLGSLPVREDWGPVHALATVARKLHNKQLV
jgi:hypothetical protein